MTPRPGCDWNPQRYDRNARFVAELGLPVLELLAPQPGERVLDLGCGDGTLTWLLAERGCRVLGVDASAAMVEVARQRSLEVRCLDGEALDYEGGFDAVFSNAALHWMTRPDAVIGGVWRALRPGGRFVGEFGGAGNVAAIVATIEAALRSRGVEPASPWYFPTAQAYRERLEAAGFEVGSIGAHERPTRLPGDVGGWLETFAGAHLAPLAEAERGALIAEVVEALRPRLCDDDGVWWADYVRLRFAATKPA